MISDTQIWLIIYFIQIPFSYWIIRSLMRKKFKYIQWDWGDVIMIFMCSLVSPIAVPLLFFLCNPLNIRLPKPLSWL